MYSYQDFAKAVYAELQPGESFEEWDDHTFYSSEPPPPEMTFCERWFIKGNLRRRMFSPMRTTSLFSSRALTDSGKSSPLTRRAHLSFLTRQKPGLVKPGLSCWANKPVAQG